MSEVIFITPGDIETATGGYGYDRRLIELMPSMGVEATHIQLSGQFPTPSREDVKTAIQHLDRAPSGAKFIIDWPALGVLPAEQMHVFADRTIALIHHPLARDSGFEQEQRQTFFEGEQASLSLVHHVIVTSPSTAALLMNEYDIPDNKITVAEPGTDPAQRATGTGTPLQLLAVGSLVERRGYDVLIDALKTNADRDWRMAIVGALDREPETTERLRRKIIAAGFEDRIHLTGVVVPATLNRHYASADIFVLPSLYEGYGMALGDAMARGLPIICTTGGAAAASVPASAAIKVKPGNRDDLAEALESLLVDRKLRERLSDASWEAGRKLPTWNETARRVAAVILDIAV